MSVQVATTPELDEAQRIVIEKARFTMEHNMPTISTFEKFTLKQGEKSITVPKVGQMEAHALADGVDLVDSEDIGMTTTSLTSSEVGLKVYLSYKLVRQLNESAFAIVGRQMGDAIARNKDEAAIALFTGLSNELGADNKNFSFDNFAACIAYAKSNKFPRPIKAIHHPNAVWALFDSLVLTPSITYGVPSGPTNSALKDFYKWSFNGVDVFEDGNIDKVSGQDSGYGALFGAGCFAYVEQMGFTKETDKDISMRAHELVVTCDYGVFEIDDSYGAKLLYEIGNPATNN